MPRVKYMRVTADWFVELCKGGETRRARPIAHVLPSDARFVDAKITETGTLILVIESQSYPELMPGSTMIEQPATEFEVVRRSGDPAVLVAVERIKGMVDRAATDYREIVPGEEWAALMELLK